MEVVTDDVTLGSEWADSVMWVRKEVEFYQHMYSVHVHVCVCLRKADQNWEMAKQKWEVLQHFVQTFSDCNLKLFVHNAILLQ